MNWTSFSVFAVLFVVVAVAGFLSARWQRGDLDLLDEWGLAGRRFGTWVTWFLLGGDLYTAYTFIAVPAAVYGQGAIGFFAVPYTILVFPIMFLVIPRLWTVSKQHGYVTPADFVRGRYDSSGLALAVAVTGILATMPYIALQLVGIEAVLKVMGISGSWPLFIAFAVLAAYTSMSGLRAPALTAIIKDILIYTTIIAAIIIIPAKLGGFGHIFQVASQTLPTLKVPASVILSPKAYSAFATLALGSAFALLLYPHAVTGALGAKSAQTIERNASILPLYSLALAFIAMLGYMAIAAHIHSKVTSLIVPLLFAKMFPKWFAGFAFGAVAIGALVPAAIMSIAAANLFTRNIYKEYFVPNASSRQESRVAKILSLIVIAGGLVFVVAMPLQYAINLQLLGGIWILQTMPSIVVGLYSRYFHRYALIVGWAVGMVTGTLMAASTSFKSSVFALHMGHSVIAMYAAVWAVLANFVVSLVLTWLFNAAKVSKGEDLTLQSMAQ